MSVEAWVAVYASIVATGALALEVRRWFEGGPRLYVSARPNMAIVGTDGVEAKGFLFVQVVNRGDAPTTVKNMGIAEFQSRWRVVFRKPSREFLILKPYLPHSTPTLPKYLEPGQLWTGIAQDPSDVTGDIQNGRFWVTVYTTDRNRPYWARIPKRLDLVTLDSDSPE